MVTCMIWGQFICDDCLSKPVRAAVRKVLMEDEEVQFVFCQINAFQSLCLSFVMEARQKYRDKKVTIAYMPTNPWEYAAMGPKATSKAEDDMKKRIPDYVMD